MLLANNCGYGDQFLSCLVESAEYIFSHEKNLIVSPEISRLLLNSSSECTLVCFNLVENPEDKFSQ